ncbi:MAG: DNA primase [Mesorhizobium sp.]
MSAADPIPDEMVDKARAMDVGAVAVRLGFDRPIPANGRVAGPCPGCGGRDRFAVNMKKNVWSCRQGGGDPIGGDAIALVRHARQCSFRTAVEILTGENWPVPAAPARDETTENEFREKERRRAFALWREGEAFPDGGAVFRYLARRGIDPDLARMPGAFCREHPDMPFWHFVTPLAMEGRKAKGEWRVIHRGPAMMWPIVDRAGRFLGLHSTFLDDAGAKGKAEIFDPATGEQLTAKKVRGSQKGGRIVLRDVIRRVPGVAAGEGIESVLSWYAIRRRDVSLEATVSLGNLAGRAARSMAHPTLKQPPRRDGRVMPLRVPGPDPLPGEDQDRLWQPHPGACFAILIADGDSDTITTHAAMMRARARLVSPALAAAEITADWPPEGADFNTMLTGARDAVE